MEKCHSFIFVMKDWLSKYPIVQFVVGAGAVAAIFGAVGIVLTALYYLFVVIGSLYAHIPGMVHAEALDNNAGLCFIGVLYTFFLIVVISVLVHIVRGVMAFGKMILRCK